MERFLDSDLELVVKSGFLDLPLLFDPAVEKELSSTPGEELPGAGAAFREKTVLEVGGRHYLRTLRLASLVEAYPNLGRSSAAHLRRTFLERTKGPWRPMASGSCETARATTTSSTSAAGSMRSGTITFASTSSQTAGWPSPREAVFILWSWTGTSTPSSSATRRDRISVFANSPLRRSFRQAMSSPPWMRVSRHSTTVTTPGSGTATIASIP